VSGWNWVSLSINAKACHSRIVGFLDFVHRPELEVLENTTFRTLDLLLSSGEGKETSILFGPLERARLPLWSNGHTSWLQTQRFCVQFPALPDFLSISGSGTGSTQPLWG
jgi:hypothetical protein